MLELVLAEARRQAAVEADHSLQELGVLCSASVGEFDAHGAAVVRLACPNYVADILESVEVTRQCRSR